MPPELNNALIRRNQSHLNTAAEILIAYKGNEPFSFFIKKYFAQHKKFGSRDRKQVSHLCYCFFRLGKSFADIDTEKRILKGLQLCTPHLSDDWQAVIDQAGLPSGEAKNIFPFKNKLSEGTDDGQFIQSHLIQPDLFLRIRPGKEKVVTNQLSAAGILFELEGNAVRILNNTSVNNILHVNKDVVIQDLSSQKIASFLGRAKSEILNQKSEISIWDCCAASGGKSILAKDVLQDFQLLVSDTLRSIIHNLKKRFSEAGITNYNAAVADVKFFDPGKKFDLIIADVPCSGSGTWSRTPEQLSFFDEPKVEEYVALQRDILNNVKQYVHPGGYLLFITCSVFAKENEMQVQHTLKSGMELVMQKLIKGYENRADTMFAALLRCL